VSTGSDPLLQVQGLHAGYERSPVLFGVDLQVGRGEIVGLLGRNGMGKTTLVRSVMGLLPTSAGTVTVAGRSMTGQPAHRVARQGLALVPEGRQVFANLSVEEHLTAFQRGGTGQADDWTVDRVYALFPRLAERRRNGGAQLSGGEQQMLSVARALLGRPRLLLLDEPLEGLAPLIRQDLLRAFREMSASLGITVVIVEQQVDEALAYAGRAVILERGAVAHAAPADQLRDDLPTLERYVGMAVH